VGPVERVAIAESRSAAMFRNRVSPSQNGAHGAPSSSSPPAPTSHDSLQCKVVTAMTTEALKGFLPLPARVLLAGYAETAKAACDAPPPPPAPPSDEGAGGAPGAR
jgi:hypothetical protein